MKKKERMKLEKNFRSLLQDCEMKSKNQCSRGIRGETSRSPDRIIPVNPIPYTMRNASTGKHDTANTDNF